MRTGQLLFIATFLLANLALCSAVLAHGDGEAHAEAATGNSYNPASSGTRNLVAGPVVIRMLADASNLGSDQIEVGELNLPKGFGESDAHAHTSLEIFYVVEGVLGHTVNGTAHRLSPGMLGFVKPGDSVKHAVLSDGPVRALVIWVPGGEAQRLVDHAGFASEPVK